MLTRGGCPCVTLWVNAFAYLIDQFFCKCLMPESAFLEPSIFSDLSDQFAFRPTGSTTGAIVSILHSVTHHLLSNSYVIVMSLDFSKASDTVRHSTLLQKLARLPQVYNWLVDFFSGHSHCTEYCSDICQYSTRVKHRTSILCAHCINEY